MTDKIRHQLFTLYFTVTHDVACHEETSGGEWEDGRNENTKHEAKKKILQLF